MILHVVDQDGTDLYVTELNAVDASTGQARVIFVDPEAGKTYIHLYSDFFQVVTEEGDDGVRVERPRYEVKGVVDKVPLALATAAPEKASKKKQTEKAVIKTKPIRTVITASDEDISPAGASAHDETDGSLEDETSNNPENEASIAP